MSDTTTALRETESIPKRRAIPRKRRGLARPILLSFVVLGLLAGGYFEWRHLNTYESTDNAQVDGRLDESPRISVPIPSTTTPSQLTASRSARADAAAGALGATRQLNAAGA